jgi:hypothetical protein
MGTILATLLRVCAGLGLGWAVDKFIPDPPAPKTGLSGMPVLRLVIIAVVVTIGILLIAFVGKKLGIKILNKK